MDAVGLERLQQQLQSVQAQFDSWCTTKINDVETMGQDHQDFLSQQQAAIDDLKKQEAEVVAEQKNMSQRAKLQNEEIDDRQKELQELRLAAEKNAEEISLLRQNFESDKENFLTQQAVCKENEEVRKHKKIELGKGMQLYQERLGLKFMRPGDGGVRLSFDNIDPKDPARVFYFEIALSDGDDYRFLACSPQVEKSTSLMAELKETNNFSAFVRAMRREFKAMCV